MTLVFPMSCKDRVDSACRLEPMERSTTDDSNTDMKHPVLNPIHGLVTHHNDTLHIKTTDTVAPQRPTRDRRKHIQKPFIEETGPSRTSWTSIRGIVSIPQLRRRRLLNTSLLAAGQVLCCAVMQNYEVCRGTLKTSCVGPWTLDLGSISSGLATLLNYLHSPSTSLFVFTAQIYGTLAMLQCYVNQADKLQEWSLSIGIIAGVVLVFPSLAMLDESLALVSPLGTCMTGALTFSAAAHWFWRTFHKPTRKSLDSTIDRPAREKHGMDSVGSVDEIHESV